MSWTKNDERHFLFQFGSCLFFIGFFAATGLWAFLTADIKGEAIKRGFARYNETTGAWEWKESK